MARTRSRCSPSGSPALSCRGLARVGLPRACGLWGTPPTGRSSRSRRRSLGRCSGTSLSPAGSPSRRWPRRSRDGAATTSPRTFPPCLALTHGDHRAEPAQSSPRPARASVAGEQALALVHGPGDPAQPALRGAEHLPQRTGPAGDDERSRWHPQILRDEASEPVRGQWEPIVAEEVWWAVQERLDAPGRPTTRIHLGSGLYRCGMCERLVRTSPIATGVRVGTWPGRGPTSMSGCCRSSGRDWLVQTCWTSPRRPVRHAPPRCG